MTRILESDCSVPDDVQFLRVPRRRNGLARLETQPPVLKEGLCRLRCVRHSSIHVIRNSGTQLRETSRHLNSHYVECLAWKALLDADLEEVCMKKENECFVHVAVQRCLKCHPDNEP